MVRIPQPKWRQFDVPHPALNDVRRASHSATLVGHKIWCLGGMDTGEKVRSDYFILDFVKKEWRVLLFRDVSSEYPTGIILFGHSGTLVDDRIIYTGGVLEHTLVGPVDDVFCFDTVLEEFKRVETFGEVKRNLVCPTANLLPENDEIVVFGGTGVVFENNHHHPLYSLDTTSMTWRKLKWRGKAPVQRFNHTSCMLNRKLYLYGGYSNIEGLQSDLQILDFSTPIPTFSEPITHGSPVARFGTVLFPFRGHLFLQGGKMHDKTRLNDMFRFDVVENEWHECRTWEAETKPTPCSNHKLVHLYDRVLVLGGATKSIIQYLEISFEYD